MARSTRRSPRPVVHDPKAAPSIPKEPPAPIQEMPPDQKPAGQNVQWIPGYWSWDVSRRRFIWISGIWREPPPNNQWVPGYWHQVDGGLQWVSGTWIPVSTAARRRASSRICRRRRRASNPGPNTPPAVGQRELDARVLVVARVGICLAARVLGCRSAQLDLDARPLCLDTRRLSLRPRLLGPAASPTEA